MSQNDAPVRREEGPGYFEESRSFAFGIASILPLAVLYQCGIVQSGYSQRNLAEVWLSGPMRLLGLEAATALNVLLVVAFVAVLWRSERSWAFHWTVVAAVVAEAGLYAVALYKGGPVLADLLNERTCGLFFAVGLKGAAPVLLALGAGVYEELLFRLLLIGGVAWMLHKLWGWDKVLSVGVMLVVSSVLFSLAHYVGPLGEPARTYSFFFRAVCGLVLGIVFLWRGLGVAVWTHAIYNGLVMLSPA
jgi:membrane protease YdiL (CAAX protease family)